MEQKTKKPLSHEDATKPVTAEESDDDQAWQDEQTRQAIEEADAGDFATRKEVKAVIRKFVPDA